MDPLTAVSLVGTILQFIDFGSKLVSEGKELYHSTTGALEDNIRIADVTSDLRALCVPIQSASLTYSGRARGIAQIHQHELQKLATACMQVADKLMPILEGLQVAPNASHKTWHVIRQSIRGAMHKEEISQLRSTLTMLQQQLDTRTLAFLSDVQWSMQADIAEIKRSSRVIETDTWTRLESIRSDLISCLSANSRSQAYQATDILQRINALNNELEKGTKLQRSLHTLESLHYDYFMEREYKIAQSHAETFQWMYDDGTTEFSRWLGCGKGVFWVTGKAGSGKSTLMKYISDHDKTRRLLAPWTDSSDLVIAKHFFWVSGKELEKSHEGLLRSLLYQILKQRPHDIPNICSERWKLGQLYDKDTWTLEQLTQCLERFSESQTDTKLFLLIDGLDEYQGEEKDIVKFIRKLASHTRTKICVSSRPWPVFETEFGSSTNKLLLEDLTCEDIRRYVQNELSQDKDFALLKHTAPEYDELTEQITEKAKGVFLWVFLVVRSLLRGLGKHDGIAGLKKRVDLLPKDLDQYFQRMLDNIEQTYRDETSRLLLVATTASEPLPVAALDFLQMEKDDPRYALRGNFPYLYDKLLLSKATEWKERINSRCTDLMEVHVWNVGDQFMRARVEFLHRSVRDFLLQGHIDKLLLERIKPPFDPRTSLCRIHVALIKSLPMEQGYATQARMISKLCNAFVGYARSAEIYTAVADVELNDALDAYLSQHTMHLGKHWTDQSRSEHRAATDPFLMFALSHGLYLYAEQHIMKKDVTAKNAFGRELLQYALGSPEDADPVLRKHRTKLSLLIFDMLLETGQPPNERMNGDGRKTLWVRFIEWCCEREARREWDESIESSCTRLLEDFLLAGADPKATLTLPKPMTVLTAIRQMLPRDRASHIKDTIKSLPDRSSLSYQLSQISPLFHSSLSAVKNLMLILIGVVLAKWVLSP
ncbi:hypothetical protein SVAN01_11464 [Stagonosporopsis vannaccii]|nr:hypothetical protein SVAN01_11464 [Stagonosporopsis vannaccii]